MTKEHIYLDYNATAPLLPEAHAAMVGALSVDANPSSVHAPGRAARRIVEDARRDVADLAGGKAEHVVFTSGATEAATTLLTPHWTMGRAPVRMSRLYVAATDHPCLLSGGRFEKAEMTVLPVDGNGVIDLEALEKVLAAHDRTQGLPLVAVHAANNESGVLQPVEHIAGMVRAAGGVLVVDAVQMAGRLPLALDSGKIGDFVILSAHKIGAPKGVGAFVGRSDLMMPAPLVVGGGQEKGHRAGTENVAGVAGFGAAARIALAGLDDMKDVTALRDRFEATVKDHAPDAVLVGGAAARLPNTLFFAAPGMKAETLQMAFDLEGIALSAGSACSSGKVGPSHVLAAMGLDADAGAIRVSIGRATTENELNAFAETWERIVARRAERRRSAA
ncbi:MAG: cysteine desulfurase [Rhizobiaceae bacterium]|nr:cysteine desulfurase [Rhizobiaceae bacterium]MCV0407175.1 cysteine desulfurase [Rhizobiaceae bacterium]